MRERDKSQKTSIASIVRRLCNIFLKGNQEMIYYKKNMKQEVSHQYNPFKS